MSTFLMCSGWLPGGKTRCSNQATKVIRRKFSKGKRYFCERCFEIVARNASPQDPLRITSLAGPAP
jgi:hypothetical protein